MIVEYRINGKDKLYDFTTIKQILKTDRSKLQRDLRRVSGGSFYRYKNQFLYKEETLFQLLEERLIEELDKIDI